MNKMPKLIYKERPLNTLVNVVAGSPDWREIAPIVRDWCNKVTIDTNGELSVKVSPDVAVFTFGGNIRQMCNNKIQLSSGDMTIKDNEVVVCPQYDRMLDMYTIELLFHGVMKIWVGYQLDYSPDLYSLRKPENAIPKLQSSDTSLPPDMSAAVECHSTRVQPIRICSFRVEAENNIFYMKAVLE